MPDIDETISDNLTITQTLFLRKIPRPLITNITRWITASITRHFDNYKASNMEYYLEGQDQSDVKEKDVAELRLNGPFVNQIGKNQYVIDVDVNILITTTIDNQNLYKHQTIIDQYLLGFLTPIEVLRLGPEIEDDGSFVECLNIVTKLSDDIVISNFGRVDATLRILQSTINGIYTMDLST